MKPKIPFDTEANTGIGAVIKKFDSGFHSYKLQNLFSVVKKIPI